MYDQDIYDLLDVIELLGDTPYMLSNPSSSIWHGCREWQEGVATETIVTSKQHEFTEVAFLRGGELPDRKRQCGKRFGQRNVPQR
jgi:hypothetical protein